MRLLIVSPWFPFPPDNGSRQRAWNLIRRLSDRHEVRLVVGRQDDATGELPLDIPTTVVPWQWYQPGRTGLAGSARALLSSTPRSVLETPNPVFVEAVQTEFARTPECVLALELASDAYLPARFPCPVVLDQVELSRLWPAPTEHTTAWERIRRGLTYTKGRRYWRTRLARYSGVTVVSEEEGKLLQRLTKTTPKILPNGVDLSTFPYRASEQGVVPGRMLYHGALSYGPNCDAVCWFVEAILPRITPHFPEAHLVVTGRSDQAPDLLRNHPQVTLTGWLPELQTELARAQLCVVPLRVGSGTRIKLLEAWAAGVPTVSTPLGAAGLAGSCDGEQILLAETAEAFAEKTLTLLKNPAVRARLAWQARKLVETTYSWDTLTDDLESYLHAQTV